jgi:hypothetical protein
MSRSRGRIANGRPVKFSSCFATEKPWRVNLARAFPCTRLAGGIRFASGGSAGRPVIGGLLVVALLLVTTLLGLLVIPLLLLLLLLLRLIIPL